MPLGGLRLTGFCAASKLFFAASQKAFSEFSELEENFHQPRATSRIHFNETGFHG